MPEDWRVANVYPLFKKGDRSITTNYKPISKSKKKSRKKSKSEKGKKSEKLRRKSSRSPAHADPAVIYTALVRKDGSESQIPFLFNLKSVCTFGTFKKRVLEACCPAHRVNARLFYEQQTCKVQLNKASWDAFLHFLKSKEVPTFILEVESSSTSACTSSRSTGSGSSGLFSSSQSQGTCISPNVDPKKSMLTTITEHEWSSVYISGCPKKSREEAMKELLLNNIKEQQCKSCQNPHRHKVAVPCCAEAVVSHGHCYEIIIKRDNLWQHIKSSHVEDPVRSHYRGMSKNRSFEK